MNRIHLLDRVSEFVDIEEPACESEDEHAEHPRFPFRTENRLPRVDVDLAEAVLSAKVMNAVHRPFPSGTGSRAFREACADHGVPGDEGSKLVLAHTVGSFGAHRKHHVTKLRIAAPGTDL